MTSAPKASIIHIRCDDLAVVTSTRSLLVIDVEAVVLLRLLRVHLLHLSSHHAVHHLLLVGRAIVAAARVLLTARIEHLLVVSVLMMRIVVHLRLELVQLAVGATERVVWLRGLHVVHHAVAAVGATLSHEIALVDTKLTGCVHEALLLERVQEHLLLLVTHILHLLAVALTAKTHAHLVECGRVAQLTEGTDLCNQVSALMPHVAAAMASVAVNIAHVTD